MSSPERPGCPRCGSLDVRAVGADPQVVECFGCGWDRDAERAAFYEDPANCEPVGPGRRLSPEQRAAIREARPRRPNNVGVGEVTCPCGETRLTASGTVAAMVSMTMRCPSCRGYAEVLADDNRRP